jgi:hypothetical protein
MLECQIKVDEILKTIDLTKFGSSPQLVSSKNLTFISFLGQVSLGCWQLTAVTLGGGGFRHSSETLADSWSGRRPGQGGARFEGGETPPFSMSFCQVTKSSCTS